MKWIYAFTVAVITFGCQNSESDKVKHLEARFDSLNNSKEKQVSIHEAGRQADSALKTEYKDILSHEEKRQNRKYCYVYVETNEPEVQYLSGSIANVPGEFSPIDKHLYYTSDIREVENYTEDERYRLMDSYENKIRTEMFLYKNERLKSYGIECKIEKKKCFVFNTYKEASEHRTLMRQ